MAKILIIATERYSINACDFDLMFRHSDHKTIAVLHNVNVRKKKWFNVVNKSNCPANRNGTYTNLKIHKCVSWKNVYELAKLIQNIEHDYVCIGNGNDAPGLAIQRMVKSKFLFSEYGWLPWNECFYVDDKGTGALSSIRNMSLDGDYNDCAEEIEYVKQRLNTGNGIKFNNYIYVPLQVDTPTSDGKPDFKFRFTKFKNNNEFLQHVRSVVPNDKMILVKRHPSAKQRYLNLSPNMIDISDMKLNKYELYQNMDAMVVINSTSVLEAMLFNKPVFSYGQDIFSEKELTYESIEDKEEFKQLLSSPAPSDNYKKFLSVIFQRQFKRKKWLDKEYVKSHYWNQALI